MDAFFGVALSASEKAALWVAAGSLVLALLSLVATIVALAVTVLGVRDAQRANLEAKKQERELASDERGFELLEVAGGKGNPGLNVQLVAIAMLREYPQHLYVMEALQAELAHRASVEPASNWPKMAQGMEHSIAYIKQKVRSRKL